MKKNLIAVFSLIFTTAAMVAQNPAASQGEFKPSGKPIVTVFSDFSNTTTAGKSNNAFEVSRAYLGYGYNFSPDFSGKVVFDIANKAGLTPSDFTVFLKNAYAEYSHGIVKANLGMVGTTMFGLQESVWGKRYLYKSFQDQYGFGNSADLGASVKLQFIPQVSLDLAVFNGEGYKKVQGDSTMQFAAGLTLQPIKNLYVRAYYDYLNKQSYLTSRVAQTSFNVFVGYKSDKGTVAAEYNSQNGNKNTAGHNWSGISVYGTLPFAKQFTAIARFDDLMSKKAGASNTGWNTSTDGQVYLAGVEYAPVKGIQITPNVRYSQLTTGNASTSINVNVGMSF
ncbi:MAG TPA: hypothetical protein VK152_05595 [Paludibacter sp.]|nr:hypothetical protein [Paludibacter sp.]